MILDVDKIKPYFDGKELTQIFGVSQGKIVKHLLDNQFEWQINNPLKTKDDYTIYIAENKDSILKKLSGKK